MEVMLIIKIVTSDSGSVNYFDMSELLRHEEYFIYIIKVNAIPFSVKRGLKSSGSFSVLLSISRHFTEKKKLY